MKALVFVFTVLAAVFSMSNTYGQVTIVQQSAASSAASSVIAFGHIYGIQSPGCCNCDVHEVDWSVVPATPYESGLFMGAESATLQSDCPLSYHADIVFEARKSRIEGVGAQSLNEFVNKLNQAAIQGCQVPAVISIVGYACIGCDKGKSQPVGVVENLAKERAARLKDAALYLIQTRGYRALSGVSFNTSTQIVDIPTLGVVGKTATMNGEVGGGYQGGLHQ